jgi:hypothetical protein
MGDGMERTNASPSPATVNWVSRQGFLTAVTSTCAVLVATPSPAQAAPLLLAAKERRQLEVCLVAVWRVIYWAERLIATDLADPTVPVDQRKARYLEARLGAKAMLTSKVGGGANYQVYTLSTLQLPECLQDLTAVYDVSRSFAETSREFYESIASLVEFDGMDTLTDPSPRSSLTLTQFDARKESYVQRILAERVVPLGRRLITAFSSDSVAISERYVQQNYPNEVFPKAGGMVATNVTSY